MTDGINKIFIAKKFQFFSSENASFKNLPKCNVNPQCIAGVGAGEVRAAAAAGGGGGGVPAPPRRAPHGHKQP